MIAYGGSPFGLLFGGAAANSLGIQPSYTTMSILMMILFVISLRTPLRSYVIGKAVSYEKSEKEQG